MMEQNMRNEVMDRAHAAGSTATTIRGASRYLLAHRSRRPRSLTAGQTPSEFKASESARRSDPEAKRARSDRAFRRRYLARLRRREVALTRPAMDAADLMSRPSRSQMWGDLTEIHRLREVSGGRWEWPTMPSLLPDGRAMVIPVEMDDARAVGITWHRRGAGWTIIPSRHKSRWCYEPSSTDWSGGVDRPRHVATHNEWHIRSVAIISATDQRVVEYIIHDDVHTHALPVGLLWVIDGDGLAAREESSGYVWHPDARALRGSTESLAAEIREGLDLRRQIDEERAARRQADVKDLADVWVNFDDSIAAGNCTAGTRQGATAIFRSLGFQPDDLTAVSVRAVDILRVRDDSFTRRAISVAKRRVNSGVSV